MGGRGSWRRRIRGGSYGQAEVAGRRTAAALTLAAAGREKKKNWRAAKAETQRSDLSLSGSLWCGSTAGAAQVCGVAAMVASRIRCRGQRLALRHVMHG